MTTSFKSVDAETARKVYDSGARVIDVRSQRDYGAGHIEGSDRVESGGLRSSSIGRADAILIVCRNGAKSKRAAKKLAKEGYRVYHLDGGLRAWRDRGYAIVSSDGERARIL